MAVKDFRYNAWYGAEKAPDLKPADYRLMLSGLIADKKPWTVEQLYALPQVSQVTRHVCVEGWSMIGKWSGTPLRTYLERVGADLTAKYVGFECADGYYEGMDMPTALHPQTLMAFRLSDEILPRKYGYPPQPCENPAGPPADAARGCGADRLLPARHHRERQRGGTDRADCRLRRLCAGGPCGLVRRHAG